MLPLLTLAASLLISQSHTNVILITLDGVRWQEIFNGIDPVLDHHRATARELLPNFYDLFVDHGATLGEHSQVVASGLKHISLPGYLEITRGHPSTCQSNDCIPTREDSVFDLPFSKPAVFASWETVERTVPTNMGVVVNTGCRFRSPAWESVQFPDFDTYPSPFTWLPNYRPDFFTGTIAEAYIEIEHPDFAWISLGNPDEWGHANNYPRYLNSLQDADEYVGRLVRDLETTDYGKNTVFIITTDHGRATNFRDHGYDQASARVWMMFHGKGISSKGSIALPHKVSLSNILPTIREIEVGPTKDSLFTMMGQAQ